MQLILLFLEYITKSTRISNISYSTSIFEYSALNSDLPISLNITYNAEEQQLLEFTMDSRYFSASGFQFCYELNESILDSLVVIKALKGSVAKVNPDTSTFVNLIDLRAYEIYRSIARKLNDKSNVGSRRLACYMAAEGYSSYAGLSHDRLLYRLNPVNYFKAVLPAIIANISPIKGPRKKFKIAYLLMIHDHGGFNHAIKLLDILDNGSSITLIHVDRQKSSEILHESMQKWINQREKENSNIYSAENRYHNIWGHISLVFTQLSNYMIWLIGTS